jgi:DNA-binding NtrC family response regulator
VLFSGEAAARKLWPLPFLIRVKIDLTGERIEMKSDEEIIEELKRATDGLLFMSEADYPFEIVQGEGNIENSSQYFRELAGQAADAPVNVKSVDEFFRNAVSEPSWKGEQELALAKRFQAVARLLKENLNDLKVYKVGEINIAVYIVGRTPSGKLAGISTRVVET